MNIPPRVLERILTKAHRDERGCLVSEYAPNGMGYSQIGWHDEDGKRHVVTGHRVSWEAQRGPIPDGMTVDHMCKNKLCVEINHLRILTNFENARRTSGRDWPIGQCANGHSNVHWHRPQSGGKGYCRLCRAAMEQRRRDRRAA